MQRHYRTTTIWWVCCGLLALAVSVGLTTAAAQPASGQPDSLPIRLQSRTFDPLLTPAAAQTTAVSEQSLAIIQFRGPVQEQWKRAVIEAGATLYGYLPDHAFLARLDAASAARVRALPAVRWVGNYEPADRLAADLRQPRTQSQESLDLWLVALPDTPPDALIDSIEAWGGLVADWSCNAQACYLQLALAAAHVPELAALPGVVWLEPRAEPALQNYAGGSIIMRVSEVWQTLGLYGSGQIVGIADTGLDTGDKATLHPDVRGRVLKALALGRPSTGDWSDIGNSSALGHGTHIIGSILGNGTMSGSNPDTRTYGPSYAGVAPEASLVLQSVGNATGGLSGIPSDNGELMRQTYQYGARIHNNSWGNRTGGPGNPFGGYTTQSQQVDQAAWELQDMLVLFSAGNSGRDNGPESTDLDGKVDPDSLLTPGTAKNVLTVGASENTYMTVFNLYDDQKYGPPISLDRMADDADGMAAFSARGPTDDGRIKPDIVAPGTYIASLRAGSTWGWGEMNSYLLAEQGSVIDEYYVLWGGTSMATGLASGSVALVREWLTTRRGVDEPSSALMKAVLLNGAADMGVGQYGTGSQQEIPDSRPNFVNGWGRLDLAESLMPPEPRQVWLTDETTGLATGETLSYTLTIERSARATATPLRATLVWTDYPGTPAAARALVNDLDLEVITPDGSRLVGNQGLYASDHACLREGTWDACNNVEGVMLSEAPTGEYTIQVRAASVPSGLEPAGTQPFALVVSGDSLLTGLPLVYIPQVMH